jgi:predicted nucleic acid-binding Zn ribbon protein
MLYIRKFIDLATSDKQDMPSNEDLKSSPYRCTECGQRFDSLGDMQRHITIEHMQKKVI